MRNVKLSAAVALLLLNSVQPINLKTKSQLNLQDDSTVAADAVNPDFVSSMTLVDWKNYTPEETLDMYQKADYNVAEAQKAVDDNQKEIDDLNETLTNA